MAEVLTRFGDLIREVYGPRKDVLCLRSGFRQVAIKGFRVREIRHANGEELHRPAVPHHSERGEGTAGLLREGDT